jgi:hypothetical protein
MHFTDATGLLGCALALTVLAARLPLIARLVPQYRGWALLAVFVVMLVPAGGMPLAGYLRGVSGDLSITALVLLGASLLRHLWRWQAMPGRDMLLLLIAIAAAGFYPVALGWGEYDPYRMGYGSNWLLACLLGIALLAAWKGFAAITITLAAAVLAWSMGWYESGNLWDYLLDPAVSIYAAAALFLLGAGRLRKVR